MKEKRFNPYKRYNGIYIPDGVYDHPTLKPTSKLVYARLLRYAGKEGFAYPKQETLAKQLKVSLATIKNNIKQLIAEKFIVAEKGNPLTHQPNTYYFLEHEALGTIDDTPIIRRAKNSTSDKLNIKPPIKESHKEESQRKKIYKKKNNKLYISKLPKEYSKSKIFMRTYKLFVKDRLSNHTWNETVFESIIVNNLYHDNNVSAEGAVWLMNKTIAQGWGDLYIKNIDLDDPKMVLPIQKPKVRRTRPR